MIADLESFEIVTKTRCVMPASAQASARSRTSEGAPKRATSAASLSGIAAMILSSLPPSIADRIVAISPS